MPATTTSPSPLSALEPGGLPRPAPRLRAFGDGAVDLEHDFGSDDRPALVTALLAGCSVGASEEAWRRHWWQAPVGTRISALLDLCVMSMPLPAGSPAGSLTISLRCDEPACRARFDIELPPSAWSLPDDLADTPVTLARQGGEPLQLRRPTGSDLSDCRHLALQNTEPAQIAQALLQRLCLAGSPHAEDAADAAAALAEADPLVDFAVHCACPECGAEADRAIDLEAHALQLLAARQRLLLREVHGLASHYGWTEREIFEVPASRRSRYLAAIGADSQEDGF